MTSYYGTPEDAACEMLETQINPLPALSAWEHRVNNLMRWPHVTKAIAEKAVSDYRAQYGNYDPELLECSGWWLWKRTRELASLDV